MSGWQNGRSASAHLMAALGIRTVPWEPVGGSEAERRGKGLPGRRATNLMCSPPGLGLLDGWMSSSLFISWAMVIKADIETFDWERSDGFIQKEK